MEMMVPVHRGPPNDSTLRGCLTERRDEELEDPARLIGPVTEVPVVARRDRPHTRDVEHRRNDERFHGHAGPNRSEAHEVRKDERDRRGVDDVVMWGMVVRQAGLRKLGETWGSRIAGGAGT